VRGGGRDGTAGVGGGVRHENRRRTRRSVDVPAPAGEPLDLDRDTRDHSVVGRRVGEADGDGKQQLEVPAGLPDELGDRVVGRLALLRLSRPFEGEEPPTPGVEERDIVLEFVLRLRPPPDPAPPPGEAQLAVHGAEPAAEREGRLKGDVARAEIIPPGASGKTDGEPEVEPEGAGAEVEDGVAEPEVHVFEAVHRARIRRIAHAVRNREDRLQAVGDAVLELRQDARASLVRKAEMACNERGLELVLVLGDDRLGDRELLGEGRHPLRAARRWHEEQREAGDARQDRGQISHRLLLRVAPQAGSTGDSHGPESRGRGSDP